MIKEGPPVTIRAFIDEHYRHFNAATLAEAARAYGAAVDAGTPMMVTLAGAMSTAELGRSLAEMIRRGKVHAICCTGANLEEDLFNLVAHTKYERVPHYRDLSAEDEQDLLKRGLARVTDTCIPEEDAMRVLEAHVIPLWIKAAKTNEPRFPHEFLYELIRSGVLEGSFEADPKNSWMLAACEADLPIFVPGWEDSTLGNIFTARVIDGTVSSHTAVRGGIETMMAVERWYGQLSEGGKAPGFFQIGGGIAGDFPICVVPLRQFDLKRDTPVWQYFCQISDSTTSYGSYSGAEPNEKITWGKLAPHTPRFIIESDATIVAPLMFGYILGW
ncbi:MAG: deoxyhypusine synthase family protein [Planctomycetota bacterium]